MIFPKPTFVIGEVLGDGGEMGSTRESVSVSLPALFNRLLTGDEYDVTVAQFQP